VDAVLGDSLVELGRYDEAFAVFDRLAARKPGLTGYSRVSYARELLGQQAEAIEAMHLAVDAAGDTGEPAAWSRTQLGKLEFAQGQLREAAVQYRAALELQPGYVQALDALAHVEAARGRLRVATSLERQAVEQTPLPQYAGFLGDLYRLRGLRRQAAKQYRLVAAVDRLFAANGVATDLELALFNVDHGFRLRESAARARRALAERPSIEAEGVLAWALARNGRCREALRHSRRALRLGTLDAPKFFQRGMIERCLGRRAASQRWFRQALRTNPHFSPIWAPVARRLS
jgi:tetratricopeptide (TPR) repeat protein